MDATIRTIRKRYPDEKRPVKSPAYGKRKGIVRMRGKGQTSPDSGAGSRSQGVSIFTKAVLRGARRFQRHGRSPAISHTPRAGSLVAGFRLPFLGKRRSRCGRFRHQGTEIARGDGLVLLFGHHLGQGQLGEFHGAVVKSASNRRIFSLNLLRVGTSRLRMVESSGNALKLRIDQRFFGDDRESGRS